MKNYIERSMSFDEYVGLIDGLLSDNKTTGPNQSESVVGFTRLNRQRMARLGKTVELDGSTREIMRGNTRPMVWLVITEAWCGDAAQNVPVIEKIAAENDKIETRYILRDENPELMDRFLTGGSRSIPKLIAIDAGTYEVLGSWGARPQAAQDLFLKMRADGIEKPAILEEMQRWYNADKGRSVQHEFAELIAKWNMKEASAGAN